MTDAHQSHDTFDVFVSYRRKQRDQTWVRDILVPLLQGEGLKVFVDYLEFRLGAA
jgi:hypothetical protein